MTETQTQPPPQAFEAPARVNLIGEHTDYTGGLVLPMAIPFTTTASIAPSPDAHHHLHSDNFSTERVVDPADRSPKTGGWSDYPIGVLRELQALGIDPPPFSLRLQGDVPLGAGLSSSASIEVATALALLAHASATLSPREVATMCQRAENNYVLSPCGIMDQFVVTAAIAGHALLLNTRDLTYESLPMNHGELANCRVVIANSGVRHSIAGGDYGLRRRELEAGQAILLGKFAHLRDLGDADPGQLATCQEAMPPASYRRCRHIITENGRVRLARDAMYAGDAAALGTLMTASHVSQRDDFECSVPEIDFLVDTANGLSGCYGARLTGGGFGGCTVSLVHIDHVEAFVAELARAYRENFRLGQDQPKIYVCEAVDGAIARAAKTRPAAIGATQ